MQQKELKSFSVDPTLQLKTTKEMISNSSQNCYTNESTTEPVTMETV